MPVAPISTAPRRVQVLLPLLLAAPFDYAVPDGMAVGEGSYVLVPLGRKGKEMVGVVWSCHEETEIDPKKLKAVLAVYTDMPPMPKPVRQFLDWMSWYSCSSPGMVLKLALSVPAAFTSPKTETYFRLGMIAGAKLTVGRQAVTETLGDKALTADAVMQASGASRAVLNAMVKSGQLVREERPVGMGAAPALKPHKLALTPEQEHGAAELAGRVGQGFSVTLLDGVTGSGKTEVYFEAVEAALADGKQVLVMLPEIALSVQWVERFERRFGITPQVWHSAIADGARRKTWRGVATGEVRLVVGARSALFLPYRELGLIVVDEEHDGSYKQEEGVIYQGRDMAVVRARHEGLPVILVSATPSLESLINAEEGKYALVELHRRHHQMELPSVTPIDMRQEKLPSQRWVSEELKEAIAQTLRDGHQTLLFLNRRGYAPLLLCRHCGHRFACPQCTSWLVWHKHHRDLQCHHCGYREPSPARCPECHDPEHLAACGPGIERLEEEVLDLFPTVRLLTLSSETMQTPNDISRAIHQIEAGEIDIIIGTQLLAKGHHFPGLALVGIVDGDLGLAGGDLRAAERTWQLLHQLAGRAGRSEVTGKVLLQTHQPDHPVMQALIRGDRQGFLALEKRTRLAAGLPPYGRLAAVIVDSHSEEAAQAAARKLGHTALSAEKVMVFGPAPAPLYKLRHRYRHRFLVQAPKHVHVQKLVSDWIDSTKLPSSVTVRIDIDPYSFL